MFATRTDIVAAGALDGLAARHRVFVDNVANAETPGFQPSDVPFEEQLRSVRDKMLGDPSEKGAAPVALEPVTEPRTTDRADGNGLQIDEQVMRLEENTLTYEALAQAIRVRGDMLRSAITEGRK